MLLLFQIKEGFAAKINETFLKRLRAIIRSVASKVECCFVTYYVRSLFSPNKRQNGKVLKHCVLVKITGASTTESSHNL